MSGWWTAAFVALAIVVLAQAVISISLYRLVGVLLVRVPPNVARSFSELPWGDRAPVATVETLDDGAVELSGRLCVFVSPGCGACRSIGPALRSLPANAPRVVVLVHGDAGAARAWERANKPERVAVGALAAQPGSVGSGIVAPYAVLLDESRMVVAHGIVNDREMLESIALHGTQAHA